MVTVTLATWRGAGVVAITTVPVALTVAAVPLAVEGPQAHPVAGVKVTVGVPVAYEPPLVTAIEVVDMAFRPVAVPAAPVPPPPVKLTVGALV